MAAFSSQTSNGPNSFSAAPDQRAPDVARSVIVKSEGGEVGFIRPAGGYFVYGQVDDVGSPPSGTASVRENLLNVPLASGAFTSGGASFNWGSTQQPASNAAAGTYAYGLIVDDNAGNSATRTGYSVVVDGTAPFGASGTPSSMVRSGNAITITLGTQSGTTATLGNLQLTWTPVTGPYDRAGNALPTTARNEAGTSARDF